jgi:hypothetical protein
MTDMYVKWIVCNVKQNLKKEFSIAQEKWIGMKNAGGLIGQLGGWDLKHENTDHFENVQKEIWLPGMRNSSGMLGGKFSRSAKNTSRYLVSTFWNSLENHDDYVENKLLKLKALADVNNDIDSIIGRQIKLVDS